MRMRRQSEIVIGCEIEQGTPVDLNVTAHIREGAQVPFQPLNTGGTEDLFYPLFVIHKGCFRGMA